MNIYIGHEQRTKLTEAIVAPVFLGQKINTLLRHYPEAGTFIKRSDFKGRTGDEIVFNSAESGLLMVIAGAGKPDDPGDAAKLAGKTVSLLTRHKARYATMHFTREKPLKLDYWQNLIDFLFIGDYSFDTYLMKKNRRVARIALLTEATTPVTPGYITDRSTVNKSVVRARNLVDEPASFVNPRYLLNQFLQVAEECKLNKTLFIGDELTEQGFYGIHAVGEASPYESALIRLEYEPANCRGSVTLVGKGITFDSGGLNIKPNASMASMKSDMAGAAVVLAVIEAAAKLKLPVKIEALAAIAENMPGGYAYKPGDIITFPNRKTVEIMNTDAEGRLLLADALCDAARRNPGCIIEVSTLTGNIANALGEGMAGLMGTDDRLLAKLLKSGQATREHAWKMPLPQDYKESIKSKIADLKNAGYGKASGIKAGLFLAEFTGDIPFAHIDIAGPAFLDKANGAYPREGATGFGVRLLLDFLAAQ